MGNVQTTSRRPILKTLPFPPNIINDDHMEIQDVSLHQFLLQSSRESLDVFNMLSDEEQTKFIQSLVESKDGFCLQLDGRNMSNLPEWIKRCKSDGIKEIALNKNCLRDFPEEVVRFRGLERLALGSNQIGIIPDCIGKLKNLVWLDFTHNRIAHVSDRLVDLQKLASLGASDCRLTTFPLVFTRMKKLRKLGVFNNIIGSLPPEIGRMKSLTKLDLSGNNLSILPSEIGKLVNLTWLNLSNNQIVSLPDEIGNLMELRELGLAHNKLTKLPDLGNLKELVLFTAFNNQIEEIGTWILTLPKLAKVDLSANRLTKLPEQILTLPSLELLNLRGNLIAEIPPPNRLDIMIKPSSLSVLDIRDNNIVTLPISILSNCMSDLKCNGNPFFRGKIPRHVTSPTLKQISLRIFANENVLDNDLISLTPFSNLLLQEIWERNDGFRCQQCQEIFLNMPIRGLDFRDSSDETDVPFLVQFCSGNCRKSYERNSLMSSPVNMTSSPFEINSPRVRGGQFHS